MSEKQAKRERKGLAQTSAPAKKADKGNVLMAVIAVVVVLAVAALGVWAAYGKIKSEAPVDAAQEVAASTVADLAETEGTTVEELLERCGLTDSGITGESSQEEFFTILTVENYANYQGKSVDELKAEYGIEAVENDMLWQDAQMQMPMSKVAEQMGMTFEEFAEQNALPAEITAETTQLDAISMLQAAAAVEAETAEEAPVDEAPVEEATEEAEVAEEATEEVEAEAVEEVEE